MTARGHRHHRDARTAIASTRRQPPAAAGLHRLLLAEVAIRAAHDAESPDGVRPPSGDLRGAAKPRAVCVDATRNVRPGLSASGGTPAMVVVN